MARRAKCQETAIESDAGQGLRVPCFAMTPGQPDISFAGVGIQVSGGLINNQPRVHLLERRPRTARRAFNLPELTGTPKQVPSAEGLREDAARQLTTALAHIEKKLADK